MHRNTRSSRKVREELIGEIGLQVRAYQSAQDAFDEAACERLGINRSDGRALDVIDRHGQITAGQLAEEVGLSTGAVTTLLDRLERAGYVRRVRDDRDRRRVHVELTDEARRRSAEIWGPIAEAGHATLSGHSNDELAFIRDFLRASGELLREHLERLRELPPPTSPGGRDQPPESPAPGRRA